MSVLRLPCPNCRKELKVKDPALLGRKARCPACAHQFVLEWTAEEDIPIERADTAVYVPPERRRAAGSQPTFEVTANEDSPSALAPGAVPPAIPGDVPAFSVPDDGGVRRLKEIQRRNRQRRNASLLIAVVAILLVGGGYYLARPYLPSVDQPAAALTPTPPAAAPPMASDAPSPVPPPSNWVDAVSPTSGEPIALRMVPSGTRLIVNLRPAQLWSNDPQMAEVRASLTQDVTTWLEGALRTVCRHEPAQIDEVLFAWILGARGTAPELTAVVHLVEERRMSDLLDEFGSDVIDEFAKYKVYQKGDRATLILDTKTFAVAPLPYGAELADWVETANYNTSDGILDLLPHTDRDRLLTVVFEPADVQLHLEALVSEAARPAMSRVAEWFATQAETVSWSVHTGEAFHSEVLLRGPRTTSALTVEENVKRQLADLPSTLVDVVRKMRPQRSGFRQLIGRLPAMIEVSRQATITSLEGKSVRLLTIMPPKAAPNLALGTILAWDESLRTDFTAVPPTTVAGTSGETPKTVRERLQLPVDAEFNRVPLQEALDYIGREIQVSVEIDGDALKDAGFTKNMAQTFTLGKVPAATALGAIIKQYEEPGKQMVVVLDEARMTLIVLTKKFADERGLTIHDFGT